MKRKRPHFVVKESKFTERVKPRWRQPRGRHSAIRQRHRGRPAMVSIGYGSPREVRGLDIRGLQPVIIHTIPEIDALDPKTHSVILGSVGKKKKLQLLQAAAKKNITLLNVKDSRKEAQAIADFLAARKKSRQDQLQEKSKKEAEKKKKSEEKKAEEKKEKKVAAKPEEAAEIHEHHEEEERKLMEKTLTKPQ